MTTARTLSHPSFLASVCRCYSFFLPLAPSARQLRVKRNCSPSKCSIVFCYSLRTVRCTNGIDDPLVMMKDGINVMSLEILGISVMIYRYENLYLIKYWIIEKRKILYIFTLHCIFITLRKRLVL